MMRRRMAGRRKPFLDRKRKTAAGSEDHGYQAGAPPEPGDDDEGIGVEPLPWRVHPRPQAARLDRREKGGARPSGAPDLAAVVPPQFSAATDSRRCSQVALRAGVAKAQGAARSRSGQG